VPRRKIEPTGRIAPARQAAFRILERVATTSAHSDDLLRAPEVDALSAQDRALATTLVLGTLRWQLALDATIRPLLARSAAQLKPEVAAALRMGAYQLLHLDRVPAHAVIHDSVELIKQGRERGASGLVNAVLRKIATSGPAATAPRLTAPHEIAEAFAHPAWIVERWARTYGIAAAEAISRWDQEPARATLRLTEPQATIPGVELEPGAFLRDARRLLSGDVGRSEALRTGRIRIQDEASQLVAELAAAVAPNAQSVILAERLPEAQITAVDISRKRLEAMQRVLPPQASPGLHCEVADAAKLQFQPRFDLILCDVPCSGTGTIQRNPEIRLRLTELDLTRHQERQIAILQSALAGLAPGGALVYSTCSLEPEENEAVIEKIMKKIEGMTLRPIRPLLDRLAQNIVTAAGRELLNSAVQGPFLRTIPGIHACDGFFAAVYERF